MSGVNECIYFCPFHEGQHIWYMYYIQTYRADFVSEQIEISLQYHPFIHIEMVQVIEIFCPGRPDTVYVTYIIQLLLMSWRNSPDQ